MTNGLAPALPVLIVGAGPTGLTLACHLRRLDVAARAPMRPGALLAVTNGADRPRFVEELRRHDIDPYVVAARSSPAGLVDEHGVLDRLYGMTGARISAQ